MKEDMKYSRRERRLIEAEGERNEDAKFSRYEQRTKKRKSNFILNSLIGIVLLLIVFVCYQIFFSDDDSEKKQADTQTEQQQTANESATERETDNQTSTNHSSSTQSSNENTAIKESDDSQAVVTEGGKDSNVIKTIVNPSWEPVGTVQTGEHVNQYSGVDWDEMVKAISYATGIDENNMTIYFLGNNGPNKSVGTVYTKDKKEIYRVYIEWVDGKGWKPTKVEQLASISK